MAASAPAAFTLSGWGFIGSLLVGFGAFNLIKGLLNHHLLQFIMSTKPCGRINGSWGDVGILASSAIMVVVGILLLRKKSNAPICSL